MRSSSRSAAIACSRCRRRSPATCARSSPRCKMVAEIERSADLACNICKAARRIYGHELDPKLRGHHPEDGRAGPAAVQGGDRGVRRRTTPPAGRARRHGRYLDDLQRQFVQAIFESHAAGKHRPAGRRAAGGRRPLLRAHRRPRRQHRRAGPVRRHRLDARARRRRPLRRPAPRRATWSDDDAGRRTGVGSADRDRAVVGPSSAIAVGWVVGAIARRRPRRRRSRRRAVPRRADGERSAALARRRSTGSPHRRRRESTRRAVVDYRNRGRPALERHAHRACSSTRRSSGTCARGRDGAERDRDARALRPAAAWSSSSRPTPLPDGGAVATIEDVSERRRVDAVRTDFVANISHELKTPVGALAVLAETLADEDDLGVVHRVADRMVDEAHRVGTHDRRPARAVADRARRASRSATVSTSVDVVARRRRARRRAAGRGAQHRRSTCSTRPVGVAVLGDRRQLVSALGNLVENAVKYSEAGSAVQVRVARRGRVGRARWSPTRASASRPRTSTGSSSASTASTRARSRDTGGTGLGLSIVRHVATNHGGEVLGVVARRRGLDVRAAHPARRRARSPTPDPRRPSRRSRDEHSQRCSSSRTRRASSRRCTIGLTREGFRVEVATRRVRGARALRRSCSPTSCCST